VLFHNFLSIFLVFGLGCLGEAHTYYLDATICASSV